MELLIPFTAGKTMIRKADESNIIMFERYSLFLHS